jgi:hypothetical protein
MNKRTYRIELTDEERQLDALRREYDLHQSHYQRNQNRLEAYLSRHWPEVNELLALHSVTLESLLIEYGSPAQIAVHATIAAKNMRISSNSGSLLMIVSKASFACLSCRRRSLISSARA